MMIDCFERSDSEIANKISKQIEDRVRIEKEMKSLHLELKMLEKALNEYRKSLR